MHRHLGGWRRLAKNMGHNHLHRVSDSITVHSSWSLLERPLTVNSLCHLPLCCSLNWGCRYKEQERRLPENPAWTLCLAQLEKDWETIPNSITEPWKKGLSTDLCLSALILLWRKQIMLPTARVRSKLILLTLLPFFPGFLRSEVLQTPTQRGWTAAETPAWTLTKILGKSLPCTCVLPYISLVYNHQAFRSRNILSLAARETPSTEQSSARAFSTRAKGDKTAPRKGFREHGDGGKDRQ